MKFQNDSRVACIRPGVVVALIMLCLFGSARGQVASIAIPFVGDIDEPISLSPSSWGLPRNAFRSLATMSSTNNSPFGTTQSQSLGSSGVHTDTTDTFGVMTPAEPVASVTYTFKLPVVRFGGYFAAATTGIEAAAFTVQFSDASGLDIGPVQTFQYYRSSKDGLLEWHGWQLERPAAKVTLNASSTLLLDSLVATPVLEIKGIIKTGDAVKITFSSAPGVNYSAQATTALSPPVSDWIGIGNAIGDGNEMSISDPLPPVPKRFYRLHAQ